ncbi:ferredoxin--NADP reductase [Cytophaga hutchinsonii]|uniref:Phenylacetate-CoA oxygenase/reductase, PaaK subunit n=1 Tax=Cytophaga hutchinsonii (strain ATCC 33406 / DSM 1761 / CIP 103989 / NBRC 15051 / NCIMB 9469 / D465) TaxID=269798 RepID=A0A6N4SR27_CYTH3|nr:ferredoxin--NADP reductase [Cytophaga hutchinsonii]ABG58835.1 phenylacetate-CoA oxygenase/reductase, PaaK subunit [Cytophaga hutchinsonii ATCC 33406]SFX80280.1 ring-1,2-phenylacetyl-CoA epoxidase subunit PaaE [Cytophaga hutchinsonii ATCC 33406]
MSSNNQVLIEEKINETADAVTLVLKQHDSIKNYKSGQFITLLLNIGGEKVRRSYSFSSSPETDSKPSITIKKIQDGKASTYLFNTIKAGDSLEFQQPAGIFTLDKASSESLVFIGAGSGITPLISMIKTALANKKFKKICLIYSNRNEDSVIFKKKLEELKAAYSNFEVIYTYSQPHDTSLPKGRLNQSQFIKIIEHIKDLAVAKTDYFLCGPDGMLEEVKHGLEILQVASSKIHKESFVTTNENDSVFVSVPEHAGDANEVTIMYQGSEYKFTVKPGKTILQSALDEDIDLPYSCMSGLCTACMGKCLSGKVEMGDQDGLSEKEVKNGYVLTCVGRPAVAGTVIEID